MITISNSRPCCKAGSLDSFITITFLVFSHLVILMILEILVILVPCDLSDPCNPCDLSNTSDLRDPSDPYGIDDLGD